MSIRFAQRVEIELLRYIQQVLHRSKGGRQREGKSRRGWHDLKTTTARPIASLAVGAIGLMQVITYGSCTVGC